MFHESRRTIALDHWRTIALSRLLIELGDGTKDESGGNLTTRGTFSGA